VEGRRFGFGTDSEGGFKITARGKKCMAREGFPLVHSSSGVEKVRQQLCASERGLASSGVGTTRSVLGDDGGEGIQSTLDTGCDVSSGKEENAIRNSGEQGGYFVQHGCEGRTPYGDQDFLKVENSGC
jgi:hypothetical protein